MEKSLCHIFDNLLICESLLPSRTTPGLWQGIQNFGLNQVDQLMAKMKANVQDMSSVVGPLLAHSASKFLRAKVCKYIYRITKYNFMMDFLVLYLLHEHNPSLKQLDEMSEEGASLMDGDMLRSELVACFDHWLGHDVKRTLTSILIAQVICRALLALFNLCVDIVIYEHFRRCRRLKVP